MNASQNITIISLSLLGIFKHSYTKSNHHISNIKSTQSNDLFIEIILAAFDIRLEARSYTASLKLFINDVFNSGNFFICILDAQLEVYLCINSRIYVFACNNTSVVIGILNICSVFLCKIDSGI